MPTLIAFGGLPGTGKTTLAKTVARELSAVYLRIDTIESALLTCEVLRDDVGPAGYVIAYGVAEENLRLGRSVVADSVNSIQITRDAWATVAGNAKVQLLEVEILCSDPMEHRRRVETRPSDTRLQPVTWAAVVERTVEPWLTPHIIIDTARKPITMAEQELLSRIASELDHSR